jgi:hypothetical protein
MGVPGSAGYFDGVSSKMGIYSVGPFVAKSTASYSVWLRTKSDGKMVLMHYDRVLATATNAQKNTFSLTLDNGKPILYASKTHTLKPMYTGMLPFERWRITSRCSVRA